MIAPPVTVYLHHDQRQVFLIVTSCYAHHSGEMIAPPVTVYLHHDLRQVSLIVTSCHARHSGAERIRPSVHFDADLTEQTLL